MQNINRKINNKGFTLIEMLIVILIIVILLAIAVPSVIAYREQSQETADLGDTKTVYTALEAALVNVPINTADWILNYGQPPYQYTNSDGEDIHATRSIIIIGKNENTEHTREARDILGGVSFTGSYRFGYNADTNSIEWVSYYNYPEEELSVQHQSMVPGSPSEVMLYHVADNVTGYLDELSNVNGVNYNQAPYTHQ